MGIEINPDAKRKDTYIGSFDDMPNEWSNIFNVIYSNSFDQSQDPEKSAREWIRVLKNNSCCIIGFKYSPPTITDPIGKLTFYDILKLFPGEMIYYTQYSRTYSTIIIRIEKN